MNTLSSLVRKSNPFFAIVIIFLYFFSNLFNRIQLAGTSAAFFAVVGLATVLHCIDKRLAGWQYAVIGVAAYFTLFPILKGEGVLVAVAAIKDLSLPLSGILLGYFLLSQKRNLDILNYLYLPFVGYGLLQAWAFHTNMLETLLPWDADYVYQMKVVGMSVYQTDVLRYFGTLNSFFHYQLICLFIPILLWVCRDHVKSQQLLLLNSFLAYIFFMIAQERIPVATLTILSLVAVIVGDGRVRRAGWVGLLISLSIIVVVGFFSSTICNESDADCRMRNMVMLQFGNDTSFMQRLGIWREMLSMITLDNIWTGLSAGSLLPSNEVWSTGQHLSPHNAYLFFALGYGLIGLVLYFGLLSRLIWVIVSSKRLTQDMRIFILGLSFAYLFLGFFHLSFLSKLGFLFCWIIGLAMADLDAVRGANPSLRLDKVPVPTRLNNV